MSKLCQNCQEMICRTYFFKTETITGYCKKLKAKTMGGDLCKIEKKERQKDE